MNYVLFDLIYLHGYLHDYIEWKKQSGSKLKDLKQQA